MKSNIKKAKDDRRNHYKKLFISLLEKFKQDNIKYGIEKIKDIKYFYVILENKKISVNLYDNYFILYIRLFDSIKEKGIKNYEKYKTEKRDY